MKIGVVFNSDINHPAITGGAYRLLDILTGWQKLYKPKIDLIDNNLVLTGRFSLETKARKLKIKFCLFPYISFLPYRLRIAYSMLAAVITGLFMFPKQDWIYTDFVPATFLPALVIAKLRGIHFCVVCNLLSHDRITRREKFSRFLTLFADLVIVTNPSYIDLLNNKNISVGGYAISRKFHIISGAKKVYDLAFDGSVNDDRKGISTFIKVAEKLKKKAVIITSTRNLAFLENLLIRSTRELFTIRQNISHEEINQILNQSKVFLFPTHTESYGLVIGQALKDGVVVVTSDIPELQVWKDLAVLTNDFFESTKLALENYQRHRKDLLKKIGKSAILTLGYEEIARQEMTLLKKFS